MGFSVSRPELPFTRDIRTQQNRKVTSSPSSTRQPHPTAQFTDRNPFLLLNLVVPYGTEPTIPNLLQSPYEGDTEDRHVEGVE